MKNVFGLNVKVGVIDGKPLVIREVNQDLLEGQTVIFDKETQHQNKAALPTWLKIVQYILYLAGFICCMGFIGSLANVSIATAWKNGSVIIVIGVFSLIGATVLREVEKKKTVEGSEEYQALVEEADYLSTQSLECLKIPQEAVKMDVFTVAYKEKKNGKKVPASLMAMCQYIATEIYLFKEDNTVCLADISMVLGIPREGISIKKINKNATFDRWNKEEAYNKGKYKPYNIRVNGYGILWVKPYYSLQFTYEEVEYEVLFPAYELDAVCSVTGLQVEEDNSKEKAE